MLYATHTSTAETDTHLQPTHYLALALLCIALGTWASFINWEYFTHGARAMEPDEAAREISEGAALMFVVGEMAAFAVAALLPTHRLMALRHKLQAFGLAMLVFECATIILTQHGIAASAEQRAQASDSRTAELKASIAAQRENAKATRERGQRLAMSTEPGVRAQGAALVAKAQAIESKLEGKAEELTHLETERKPTSIELLGNGKALAYAIARGLLVTTAGLVFFSAAGALIRAARTASQRGTQADTYTPTPAHQQPLAPAGAGYCPPVSLPVNNVTPGPGPAYPGHAMPSHQRPGHHFGRSMAWALGAVPVMMTAATMAPRQAQASVPIVTSGIPAQRFNAQPDTSASPSTPTPAKAVTRERTNATGAKIDTGVGPLDGYRYRRIRAAVKAGKLAPSYRAIQRAEGGGQPTIAGYLAEMAREGVIQWDGRRWQRVDTQTQ